MANSESKANIGLNERIKRVVDWVLVPMSAGSVANLVLSVIIGTCGFPDAESWKTIIVLSVLVVTGGAKAYWDTNK